MLQSQGGTRTLAAEVFQTGMLQTARRDDEVITAVRFPVRPGRAAFREVARRHGDFAILAAAVVRVEDGLRVGLGGIADRPHVATFPAGADPHDWANDLAWQLGGYDDIHATARYRRDLVRRLVPILIEEVR